MLQHLAHEIPYYAVIFISLRTEGDRGYNEMAHYMEDLVKGQPGFLGMHSAREEVGITVSYWKTEEDIRRWRHLTEHQFAQYSGRSIWYSDYIIKVCKVEREYGKAAAD